MGVPIGGRASRLLGVVLVAAALAGGSSGSIEAQSAPLRWDGSLEHISAAGGYWPEPTGPSRLSRHPVSSDGRFVVFSADIPNPPFPATPQLFRRDRQTSQTEMVIGAQVSEPPVISGDGNHIAFRTCETWWRPDGAPICDVYLIDVRSWTLTNATTALDGTLSSDSSDHPVLSGDGRFVVFRSTSATLLPSGAAPGQIVWRDRDADGNGVYDEPGGVSLAVVSVSSGGVAGNGSSDNAELSADGRFVAFRSTANNLVAGDTNNASDVFLHDRLTGETRRINVGGDGQQATPTVESAAISISADGMLVAFAADDDYLTNPPTHQTDFNGALDVIVYDQATQSLTRLDVGVNGELGNSHTYWPTFSADGRYVSMLTTATNVATPGSPGRSHAYVYDRVTNQASQIDGGAVATGDETNADVTNVVLSGDGTFVLFTSAATNLGPIPAADAIFGAGYFDVPTTALTISGKGGVATATVTAQRYVQWSAERPEHPWLDWETPPWGMGDGAVSFRARENPDPTPRSTTVAFGTKTIVVTQEPGLSMAAIAPASGPMTGGTPVTITGTGFEPGIRLFFDGIEMEAEFVNSTTLRAVTPPHAPGAIYIWITTEDYRWAVLYDGFRYVDVTPPQITPYVTGSVSESGWHTADVQIDWLVWDPDSQVTSSAGCVHVDLMTDTGGTTFTCTATSEGGTASVSTTVRRDTTPPVIGFQTPAATIYSRIPARTASYTCTDQLSGVGSCTGTVALGQPIDMSPGFHMFDVEAVDQAGNHGFATVTYAVATDVCEPRPAGLVAWWPFETFPGSTVQANYQDVVSGIDAIPVNTDFRFGPGAVGQFAMSTANVPSYVNAGSRTQLKMTGAFTLSAWIFPTVDYDPAGAVIAGREGEYLLARFPDGSLRWSIANTSPGWTWVNTFKVIPRWVWSHVVVTYDGSFVATYVNGEQVHIVPASGPVGDAAPAQNDFRIGARQAPGSPMNFVGGIDDVQLLSRALSGTDVLDTFLAGNTGLCGPRSLKLTISPSPVHVTYGTTEEVNLFVQLTETDGTPVAGRTVSVKKAGQTIATGVTDGVGAVRATTNVTGAFVGTSPSYFQAVHTGDFFVANANAFAALVTDKATPQITWLAPAPVTYGTALGAAQLNAQANTPGTFTYAPAAGTVLPVGSHQLTATFQPSNTTNYTSASASTPLEVVRATPSIQLTAGTFAYDGTAHAATAAATGVGGQPLTPVTITYDGAAEAPVNAGTYAVLASYAGDGSHAPATAGATLVITKATPTVSVSAAAATYDGAPHAAVAAATGVGGQPLTPVTVTYGGAAEPPVNAGTYDVRADFAGNSNYTAASATTTLTIAKATPSVTVTGGTFTYDAAPHAATAVVTGIAGSVLTPVTISYAGSAAEPVNAGTYDVLAQFAGDANYEAASGTGSLVIAKATPTVSVSAAAATYDGAPHAASATASGVGGQPLTPVTVTYGGAAEPPVDAGTYVVRAEFAGSANYAAAAATATLAIAKATPSVLVTGGTFTYDAAPHAATVFVAGIPGSALTPVTVTYNGGAAEPVNAGTYSVVASYGGSTNYLEATGTGTVTIGKASPVLQWSAPPSIVYGTPLGGAQLNATSSTPGAFTYSPAAGTRLAAGAHPLSATFTPADPLNFTGGGTVSASIAVTPAPLTVRANDAAKPFGAPLPAFGATATGFADGESWGVLSGTLAFSTTATAQSPVGIYPIVPAGLGSPNYAIAFVNGALGVVPGTVAIAVDAAPEPSGLNQPMTFTAAVAAAAPSAGTPTGVVQFLDGGTLLGSAVLNGGQAAITTAGLDPGARTIEARYLGDGSFAAGSATATHTIRDASQTPVVTVTSSRNPATTGQTVTLTATVSVTTGSANGTVQFYSGGTLLGTGTIAAGRATLTTSSLPPGSHAVTALYTGSAGAPPARSGVFVQAVGPPAWKNKVTTMTLTSSANPSALGTTATFTARVTGASGQMPGGRILIMVDGVPVDDPAGIAVTPVSGSTAQVTLSLSILMHGRHAVTATYLGDPNYKGSTAALTQQVN